MSDELTPSQDVSRRSFLRALGLAGAATPVLLTFGCSSDWSVLAPTAPAGGVFGSSEYSGGETGSETGGDGETSGPGDGEGEAPANNAPVVSDLPDAELIVGETYEASGSFTDPDSASHTATVDYGDGTILPLTLDGTAFQLEHLYAAAGAFSVLVVVTDNRGASGSSAATVTVLSPAQAVASLSSQLTALVSSGAVAANTARPLGAPLSQASASLARGNANSARGQLGAFVNQIEAARKSGRLNAAAAASLLAYANRILASL